MRLIRTKSISGTTTIPQSSEHTQPQLQQRQLPLCRRAALYRNSIIIQSSSGRVSQMSAPEPNPGPQTPVRLTGRNRGGVLQRGFLISPFQYVVKSHKALFGHVALAHLDPPLWNPQGGSKEFRWVGLGGSIPREIQYSAQNPPLSLRPLYGILVWPTLASFFRWQEVFRTNSWSFALYFYYIFLFYVEEIKSMRENKNGAVEKLRGC